MATGLRIQQQRESHLGLYIGILLVLALAAGMGWYGYRYYTTGEQPPIPVALATPNADVDEKEVTSEEKNDHTVEPSEPRYMSIPSLGIDQARILKIGIGENGELDTPVNIHDIGWYEKSAAPGSGNSAMLMDGHNGGPTKGGVFERLADIGDGDIITVERGDGESFSYEVIEKKTLSLEELNNGGMKRMSESASETAEGLNLISCTGTWIPAQNTYDQRVTIRAVAIE